MSTAIIHTDASVPGNPGPMRIGYLIETQGGQRVAVVGQSVGDGTVNIAEYLGIIAALRHAFRLGFRAVKLNTDSQLVSRQLAGRYKVKDKKLARMHREVKSLLPAFDRVDIKWTPREQNTTADALSRDSVFTEVPLDAPDRTHRFARALLPWQAARVREALARGATEYALGRAFGLPATSLRLIKSGKTYANANLDELPRWDEPTLFPIPLAPGDFPAPTVYTTTGENDEAPQTPVPTDLGDVHVDVR